MSRTLRIILFVLPWFACSVAQEPSAGRWSPHADLIFVNGQVVTVDRDGSIREAVAVKDGRIIAVGTGEEVMEHFGEKTSVIELGSKTIIPGIQDSHIHFLGLGHDVTHQAELTYCRNAEEIVDKRGIGRYGGGRGMEKIIGACKTSSHPA